MKEDSNPDPTIFVVLELAVREIETLDLGRQMHRRALFKRTDNWQGT